MMGIYYGVQVKESGGMLNRLILATLNNVIRPWDMTTLCSVLASCPEIDKEIKEH